MGECLDKTMRLSWLRKKKKDEAEAKHSFLWIFAVVGVIVAVAAIAYVVYSHISTKRKEDEMFDDFESSFDEDFMAENAE